MIYLKIPTFPQRLSYEEPVQKLKLHCDTED